MNNILINRSRNSTTAPIKIHTILQFLTTCNMFMKTWQNLAISEKKSNFKSFHTSETIKLLILNSSFTYFHIGGEDHAIFGLDFMSKCFPIRIFLHLSVFLNIFNWFHIKVFIFASYFLIFHHLLSKTNYSLTACKDSWHATDLFDWERLSTNTLLVVTKLKPQNLFLHQVLVLKVWYACESSLNWFIPNKKVLELQLLGLKWLKVRRSSF